MNDDRLTDAFTNRPLSNQESFDLMQAHFRRTIAYFKEIDIFLGEATPYPPPGWRCLPRWVEFQGQRYPNCVPGGVGLHHFTGLMLNLSLDVEPVAIHASFSHPFMELRDRICKDILRSFFPTREFDRRMAIPVMLVGRIQQPIRHFLHHLPEGSEDRQRFEALPRCKLPNPGVA